MVLVHVHLLINGFDELVYMLLLFDSTFPLFFLGRRGLIKRLLLLFPRGGRLLLRFIRGLVVRVDYSSDSTDNGLQIGPSVGLLFRVDKGLVEANLERSDLGVDDILVGLGVDVLVFWDFEGDKVGRDHVA